MEFELKAGAKLNLLTEAELRRTMKDIARDWMVEAARGPKSVDWWGSGVITAAGALVIGGADADPGSGRYGPDASMIWSIKRLNVRHLTGNDALSVFVNAATDQRSVVDGVTGYQKFGSDELVLRGGSKILLTGTGLATAAGTVITVSGSAWELPATMMYKLL